MSDQQRPDVTGSHAVSAVSSTSENVDSEYFDASYTHQENPSRESHSSVGADDSSEISRDGFHLTRRTFIASGAVAGVAISLPVWANTASQKVAAATPPPEPPAAVFPGLNLTLKVNGKNFDFKNLDARTTLLDAVREHMDLTGSKKGCDHGQCGACTMIVDGKRINSCLTFAAQNQGKEIMTIEGLADGENLHPMQTAFIENDAFQCGFCTPGQIMSAVAMLKEPCGSSETEVRECMSGNICRCGAYRNILDAIAQVRDGKRA